jgi:hypothetical protein
MWIITYIFSLFLTLLNWWRGGVLETTPSLHEEKGSAWARRNFPVRNCPQVPVRKVLEPVKEPAVGQFITWADGTEDCFFGSPCNGPYMGFGICHLCGKCQLSYGAPTAGDSYLVPKKGQGRGRRSISSLDRAWSRAEKARRQLRFEVTDNRKAGYCSHNGDRKGDWLWEAGKADRRASRDYSRLINREYRSL